MEQQAKSLIGMPLSKEKAPGEQVLFLGRSSSYFTSPSRTLISL